MKRQNEQHSQPNQEQQQQQQQQDYDSFLYRFQQQIISAWKPVPHASSNVVLYLILSAICLGLGIALILTASSSQQVFLRYDSACAFNTTGCSVSFTLTETLSFPVYFYYGLNGYYQNHRRFIKFFSFSQKSGTNIDLPTASQQSACSTLATNSQCGFLKGADGVTNLVGDDVAFPCGTRAKSYYQLRPQLRSFYLTNSTNNNISLTRTGIAWQGDIGSWVNTNSTSSQAFDVTQQDWLVWFRPAARSSFYKLYASIQQDLPAGTYTINFNNVFNFDFGEKWFYIGKSNYVGNRDLFLGIAFTALGGICVILFIVFIARWINEKRQKASKQL